MVLMYEPGDFARIAAEIAEQLREENPASAKAGQIYTTLAVAENVHDLRQELQSFSRDTHEDLRFIGGAIENP